MERAKGFEPSTPTLARLCSTPELHPHPWADASASWGLYAANAWTLQQGAAAVFSLICHERFFSSLFPFAISRANRPPQARKRLRNMRGAAILPEILAPAPP